MHHVKKASIRDLHIRTSELVREASEGAVILIERRGEAVAELRPISRKTSRRRIPDLRALWQRLPWVSGDSGRFLEEDR